MSVETDPMEQARIAKVMGEIYHNCAKLHGHLVNWHADQVEE